MCKSVVLALTFAGLLAGPLSAQERDALFCSLVTANVPAGSTSCTANMDKPDAGRANVVVTDRPGSSSQVMLLRTDLPSGGSCAAGGFSGLCAGVDTDSPIAFDDACSGPRSPFDCQSITLFWLQDSGSGPTARTPQAARLVAIAKDLKAGDEKVLITKDAVAYLGKATASDERTIRATRDGKTSRAMTIPASAASLEDFSAAMSTLAASGFALGQLALFGDEGRILVEHNGAEFLVEPPCSPPCVRKLLSSAQFQAEFKRRFAIVPVERAISPDLEALRRVLMSALVSPDFRETEREEQGVVQMPAIYLLEW